LYNLSDPIIDKQQLIDELIISKVFYK